jgi:hypothetical protein
MVFTAVKIQVRFHSRFHDTQKERELSKIDIECIMTASLF